MDANEARFRYWAPIAERTYLLAEVDDWVMECRLLGASWQQVADGLGISKQSVHDRYSERCRYLGPVLLRVELVNGVRQAAFYSPLLARPLGEDLVAVLARAPRCIEAAR
jgi:hypothetical protein